MMKAYILGLDLGTNSAGWALVTDEPSTSKENIIAGVRVFPEGTDREKGVEKSRNQKRRDARQMRRQLDRRGRRKRKLKHMFEKAGVDMEKFAESILTQDPYELRKRALDEKLKQEEFARALSHINMRRGFKSNLKAQGDEAKEQGEIKQDISALGKEIEEAGMRTLGEYFWNVLKEGGKVRKRHTSRAMYEDEFEKIWSHQSKHHPSLCTDEVKRDIHEVIFYQRPLKPQDHLIGKCDLEPEEKRSPRASWYAQQIRVFQEVNNLRVLTKLKGERELTSDEREALLNKLMTQVSPVKVDSIKTKALKLDETEHLNYERTQRNAMEGNIVEARLRKIFGKEFEEKSEWLRDVVWQFLIEEEGEDFRKKAKDEWELTEDQVKELFKIRRPSGYASYSLKAMKKLLPHLEKGMSLHDARIAAGYKFDDEIAKKAFLPAIHPNDFRNPVVTRCLSEARKVVNAIIREHGLPSKIVVEMARETKGSIRQRQEKTREIVQRGQYHKEIETELIKAGIPANHDTIEKYKLWEECDKVCPYTGKNIAPHQLFGDSCEFDVEHIIPYPRSLDDSFLNKTLCHRSENEHKGNRTPFEAYHGTKHYEQIRLRVDKNYKMPYPKRNRFAMQELPDDFINRQLTDTSYIAKAVVAYLKQLGVSVETTRGAVTSELRYQWGLVQFFSPVNKDRSDHREHAVDAVAIALSTRKAIHALSSRFSLYKGAKVPSPWEEQGIDRDAFRGLVADAVIPINISHRPNRRLMGQLNEETNYGITSDENTYVYRVPLDTLTPAKASRIMDPVVREVVSERLQQYGLEPGKGSTSVPAAVFAEPLYMRTKDGSQGPVIETVRIWTKGKSLIPISDSDGNPYRYVKPGNNHHIAIYEYTDGDGRVRRCKDVVTRFEAVQRWRRGDPVVKRTHPDHPEAKFLMSLSINDMVMIKGEKEKEGLYRVQKLSSKESEEGAYIMFRQHTAATIDDKETEKLLQTLSVDKFQVRKVNVDTLGRIHSCKD